MASRQGSYLADKEKCRDFSSLPMGMALADNVGSFSNPFFSGIKPPRFIRAAPRASSVDVLATNLGKYMGKNASLTATKILDEYTRQAREFEPTPIDLAKSDNPRRAFYEDIVDPFDPLFGHDHGPMESVREMSDDFYNSARFTNLGDILTTQVKGSQAPSIMSITEIENLTRGMGREALVNLSRNIYNDSGIEGLPGMKYTAQTASKDNAIRDITLFFNEAQQLSGVPIDPEAYIQTHQTPKPAQVIEQLKYGAGPSYSEYPNQRDLLTIV